MAGNVDEISVSQALVASGDALSSPTSGNVSGTSSDDAIFSLTADAVLSAGNVSELADAVLPPAGAGGNASGTASRLSGEENKVAIDISKMRLIGFMDEIYSSNTATTMENEQLKKQVAKLLNLLEQKDRNFQAVNRKAFELQSIIAEQNLRITSKETVTETHAEPLPLPPPPQEDRVPVELKTADTTIWIVSLTLTAAVGFGVGWFSKRN